MEKKNYDPTHQPDVEERTQTCVGLWEEQVKSTDAALANALECLEWTEGELVATACVWLSSFLVFGRMAVSKASMKSLLVWEGLCWERMWPFSGPLGCCGNAHDNGELFFLPYKERASSPQGDGLWAVCV